MKPNIQMSSRKVRKSKNIKNIFPKQKDMSFQIEKAQQVTRTKDERDPILRHIIMKFQRLRLKRRKKTKPKPDHIR